MIHLSWDTLFFRFAPGHVDSVSDVVQCRTPSVASPPVNRKGSQSSGKRAEQKFTGRTTSRVTPRNMPIPELNRNLGGSEDNNS